MPGLPRGTVTLLFTDVEGSTDLLRRLGPAYGDALELHRLVLREAVRLHDGSEVDTQGDAFFFAFPTAAGAVRAAAEAQRALAAQTWPDDQPVRVRMGVHTGEPEQRGAKRGLLESVVQHGGAVGAADVGDDLVVRDATSAISAHERERQHVGLAALLDVVDLHKSDRDLTRGRGQPRRIGESHVADGPGLALEPAPLRQVAGQHALELGACRIVNIKVGRVAGFAGMRAVHDLCLARGAPVWCGGMLESGIGRLANVHLQTLPGFTLPGDTSASARYFEEDLVDPPVTVSADGTIAVPEAPGIGHEIVWDRVDRATTFREALSS